MDMKQSPSMNLAVNQRSHAMKTFQAAHTAVQITFMDWHMSDRAAGCICAGAWRVHLLIIQA